jgi:GT2 family glycosyltransferase
MAPLVDISVIIPTYKRAAFLKKALESVLLPSHLSIEIMVIDDSPEGEGESAVRAVGDDRVQYSRWPSPTGGWPAFLRNEAARRAKGSVLFFLDDDDEVVMPALEEAYAKLQASTAGVLVTTPTPFGDIPSKVEWEIAYFAKGRAFLERNPPAADLAARLIFSDAVFVCSSCLIKRSAYLPTGGFDETLAISEDIDFYARAIMVSGYLYYPSSITRRRVGQSSLIANAKVDVLQDCYFRMRRSFRRRHGMLPYLKYRLKYKFPFLANVLPA